MYLTLISFLIVLLPVPIILRMMAKHTAPFRAVLAGVLAAAAGTAAVMIIAAQSGQSVFSEMQEGIREITKALSENASLAEAMDIQDKSAAQRMAFFDEYYQTAAKALPASMCIMASVVSYLEYIILSKIYKPGGTAIPMTPMRQLDLPRSALMAWALMYLLSWVLTTAEVFPNDILYININVLFDFVFCLQGISVLFYFVYQKKAPRAIAVILILFFMSTVFGKFVLLILGFADLILGLKRRQIN